MLVDTAGRPGGDPNGDPEGGVAKAAKRSRVEGVSLLRRARRDGSPKWMARFVDPRTGKRRERAIPTDATTHEQRRAWAARFAREELAELRQVADRHGHGVGVPSAVVTLADAVEMYYRLHAPRLRPRTVVTYRLGTNALLAFVSERRIARADELRPAHLEAFRAWLFVRPKRGPGSHAVAAINARMRAVKTVLEAARLLGLLPRITRDALHDHLRPEREPVTLPEPLASSALRALLGAALAHDAAGDRPVIAPFTTFLLLSGMRAGEAGHLAWSSVDLDAGEAGEIRLAASETKTKRARIVDLAVSPALRDLLRAMRERAAGAAPVFGYTRPLESTRERLRADYGAPRFTWQQLRETCATYLANSSIFGAATAYREARQLGHSVVVAERHYLGVVRVDPAARTLEAAMGIEADVARVVASAR